ncbi:hypothetical protein BX600DRAFT_17251 [Xylariales sp. PMI_506]|nr:hypothetical protein BX600DRAFT_17251 [Xylariales sp. PMI_506]
MSLYQCDVCGRSFSSGHARYQHQNATNHWPRVEKYKCRANCGGAFPSTSDRDNHEIKSCHFCSSCDRHCMNDNNIRQHLNSRIHRGAALQCPFCKAGYATATGLCHHLESGSCPRAASLDRDQVYRVVRSKDPTGAISKKLIGWHGSPSYQANDRAWNGDGYECYLCHSEFRSLNGLNQHLSSPFHQQALYHCPNRLQCGKDFKSLAAVMNHLESESCGFTRFDNVQRGLQNVISADRLLSFH